MSAISTTGSISRRRTFDTTGAPYRRYDGMGKLRQQFTPSFSLGGLVTGYHNDMTGRSNGELGPQEDDIQREVR